MSSTAASVAREADDLAGEVSLVRLYVLRATYLLLVSGLGATVGPVLFSHESMARGVIPSLLGAVGMLALVGLRYPLQMLPLLMFELVWKTIWLIAFGLPQWSSGQLPATFAEDFEAIVAGVILMPIVIPWAYVYRHYIKEPANRWRGPRIGASHREGESAASLSAERSTSRSDGSMMCSVGEMLSDQIPRAIPPWLVPLLIALIAITVWSPLRCGYQAW